MGVGEEGSWELGVGGWGLGRKRNLGLILTYSQTDRNSALSTLHSALRTPLGTRNSELCTLSPTSPPPHPPILFPSQHSFPHSEHPHSELGIPLRGSKLRNSALFPPPPHLPIPPSSSPLGTPPRGSKLRNSELCTLSPQLLTPNSHKIGDRFSFSSCQADASLYPICDSPTQCLQTSPWGNGGFSGKCPYPPGSD
uniref:Uncharacterized protein n=1 Tax=Desertifilum tharense IPPAS B-1220 TaxID=1781255 RepID=A0ACD5GXY2_9CYAN